MRLEIIAALFLCYHTSCIGGSGCSDNLANCSELASSCSTSVVRRNCAQTCKVCAPDPCSVDNGGCQHLCTTTKNGTTCSCENGFRLGTDNKSCVDIDECAEKPNACPPGEMFCVNLVGKFTCQPYKCNEPGKMNYYRSGKCCTARNSSCGTTATIRSKVHIPKGRSFETPDGTEGRVYYGEKAATTAWPWMVQFTFRGNSHCGGSLVTDRWVVSAAHCFSQNRHQEMFAYLGQTRSATLRSVDRTRRVQRKIKQVINHENYTAAFRNDIALVELTSSVQFSDVISPICLPCGELPDVKTKCWVTGFGLTETSGGTSSKALMEVDVPIVATEKCAKAFLNDIVIDVDQMICAGYETGKKDACMGDSGGPLACQRSDSCDWYLAGITSFGKGCGLAGYYGVYTNVLNYDVWIRRNLGVEASKLCSKIYNPCRGKTNTDNDCHSKLDHCEEYPVYMEDNCNLACCQLKHAEITNCRDSPESKAACEMYSHLCHDIAYKGYMRKNCRKTCKFC